MDAWAAILLGLVEGITEFLPISSTGHLILVTRWLGLGGDAVESFDIVIQAGAVVAVLGLYRQRAAVMWRGLTRGAADGRRLLGRLAVSFLPAAVLGVLWHRPIKALLFHPGPVIAALAAGGLAMLAVDGWARPPGLSARRAGGGRADGTQTLEALSVRGALLIGLAQCLALWPGTSRSMVTIVAGMLVGLPAARAAEYSFLLALPTLGGAAVWELVTGGSHMTTQLGWGVILLGFGTSFVVAMLAMWGLVRYLTRHGLAVFGWYRLLLAAGVWVALRAGAG